MGVFVSIFIIFGASMHRYNKIMFLLFFFKFGNLTNYDYNVFMIFFKFGEFNLYKNR